MSSSAIPRQHGQGGDDDISCITQATPAIALLRERPPLPYAIALDRRQPRHEAVHRAAGDVRPYLAVVGGTSLKPGKRMRYPRDSDGSPAKEGVAMLHDVLHDTRGTETADADAAASGEQLARRQAVRQIERRRRFWFSTAFWGLGMLLLAVIWAISEYHNAGGWPTNGFSESSGIHDVWNFWIIYPFIAWVFLTAGSAWKVFGNKPISEGDIKREMERQAGAHR